MAVPTIVQSVTSASSTTAITITLNGVAAGNTILICCHQYGFGTRSWSAPSYVEDIRLSTAGYSSAILRRANCPAGTNSITVTINAATTFYVSAIEVTPVTLESTGSLQDSTINHLSAAVAGIDVATDALIITTSGTSGNVATATPGAGFTALQTGVWGIVQYSLSTGGFTGERGAWTSGNAVVSSNVMAGYTTEVVADVTPPTVSSVAIGTDGETVTVVFDEPVTGNGTGFTLDDATALTYVSGDETASWVFSAARTILSSETRTLEYDDTTGDMTDGSANDLASFTGQAVTNNSTQIIDVTAPTLSSATVTAATTLTLVFDEAVTLTNATGMTIASSGAAVTISSISGDGTDTLLATLSRSIASTESLSFSYDSGTGNVTDIATNALASISNRLVTNNISTTGSVSLIGSGLIQ